VLLRQLGCREEWSSLKQNIYDYHLQNSFAKLSEAFYTAMLAVVRS
jgi:hypothetical protein